MIKIKILAVGNLKETFTKEYEKEYLKRLSKFCNLEIIEVKEHNESNNIDEIKKREEKEILPHLDGFTILLDIQGKELSSEEFASELEKLSITNSKITFIIGGSYGVTENIKSSCNLKLSFSKMTFPHNLARIMLLEQIYRCFSILSGTKYHK